MTVNDAEYRVVKLLGKGKGGYSYLVTDGTAQSVLKQIHHEPCAYYTFGDKLRSELRDYETLRKLGIPMPRLLAADIPAGAHSEGIHRRADGGGAAQRGTDEPRLAQTGAGHVRPPVPGGLNIDYYPTNFVPCGGTLYYIDYECNAYMQEWDFAHWGARYWTIQAPERPDGA